MENLNQKQSNKGQVPIKGCMAGHSFVYTPNKDIIMEEYLCDCQECLCLNFVSSIERRSKFFEKKNNSEDCLLDVKNDPTKIFGFVCDSEIL